MEELVNIALYLFGMLWGLVFGYIRWAPMTPFKEGFLNGLTFRYLWAKDKNRDQ